jgi:Tol biopolymer transport system component
MSEETVNRGRVGTHGVIVAAIAVMLFAAALADAAFPGRNGRIAFVRGISPTYRPVIITMKPNGSDQRRLTGGTSPEYSPNGRQIVFVAHRDGDSEIFTIRANGTHRRQLTDNSGIEDIDPAYSPNGRQIVFSRKRSGGYEIFKMRSDGTHRRQLTHGSTGRGVVGATFSPSGRQIAYVQWDFRPFPANYAVFRMRRDGTHQRFIALGSRPNYSPSGRHIVADRTVIGGTEGSSEDIFKVGPDGSQHVWLTSTPDIYDTGPAFSPNGRWVVWSRDGQIVEMRSDGTRIRRLTHPALYAGCPTGSRGPARHPPSKPPGRGSRPDHFLLREPGSPVPS